VHQLSLNTPAPHHAATFMASIDVRWHPPRPINHLIQRNQHPTLTLATLAVPNPCNNTVFLVLHSLRTAKATEIKALPCRFFTVTTIVPEPKQLCPICNSHTCNQRICRPEKTESRTTLFLVKNQIQASQHKADQQPLDCSPAPYLRIPIIYNS